MVSLANETFKTILRKPLNVVHDILDWLSCATGLIYIYIRSNLGRVWFLVAWLSHDVGECLHHSSTTELLLPYSTILNGLFTLRDNFEIIVSMDLLDAEVQPSSDTIGISCKESQIDQNPTHLSQS